MKLTSTDKEYLIGLGYPKEDLEQIEIATSNKYTTYELDGENISRQEVLEVMEREVYLSGISRSAFHLSAKDGNEIYFNSSSLFR